jgi:probable F420-dependent oxidoreductase
MGDLNTSPPSPAPIRPSVDIGRLGVWTGRGQWPRDLGAAGEAGAELESLGFGAAWIGGSSGQFPPAEAVLAATTTLAVATGIVEMWSNPAPEVAEGHHRLTARHPGRFLLGLGPGHAPTAEAVGERYLRPLAKLASYLDELDRAEHPVALSERVLAALGPKALAMSARRSAGAHPYNVTPDHTAQARSILGPTPLLAPEQKLFFGTDPSVARQVARRSLAIYLQLPNYLNNFRRLGFDDGDFADGGSDRLVDAMVAWGSGEGVARRVQEHMDAGASHVTVQVLSTGKPGVLPRTEWRVAAQALLG